MTGIIKKIVVLKIQADLLMLKLLWKFALLFLKVAAVLVFINFCVQVSEHSERLGWFVFLAALFMVPRYDIKKEQQKNVIHS